MKSENTAFHWVLSTCKGKLLKSWLCLIKMLFPGSVLLLIPPFNPFSSVRAICSLSVFYTFKSLSSYFISKQSWLFYQWSPSWLKPFWFAEDKGAKLQLFCVFWHSPRLALQDEIFLFPMTSYDVLKSSVLDSPSWISLWTQTIRK